MATIFHSSMPPPPGTEKPTRAGRPTWNKPWRDGRAQSAGSVAIMIARLTAAAARPIGQPAWGNRGTRFDVSKAQSPLIRKRHPEIGQGRIVLLPAPGLGELGELTPQVGSVRVD